MKELEIQVQEILIRKTPFEHEPRARGFLTLVEFPDRTLIFSSPPAVFCEQTKSSLMPADPLSRWHHKSSTPETMWKKMKNHYNLRKVKTTLYPKEIEEVLRRVDEKVQKFGFGDPLGSKYRWRRAYPKHITNKVCTPTLFQHKFKVN